MQKGPLNTTCTVGMYGRAIQPLFEEPLEWFHSGLAVLNHKDRAHIMLDLTKLKKLVFTPAYPVR